MFQSHSYCHVFSALIREHWSELKAFTTIVHFDGHEVIFSVGDPPDAMFLINRVELRCRCSPTKAKRRSRRELNTA